MCTRLYTHARRGANVSRHLQNSDGWRLGDLAGHQFSRTRARRLEVAFLEPGVTKATFPDSVFERSSCPSAGPRIMAEVCSAE